MDPVLVVGGTGKTGRRVAERLTALEVPVRIGSRSGEPPFDWDDRSTWAPALRGTSAAYVTYYPDLAVPGAADAIAALAALALEGGARRIVLLSGRGEPEAERAERALADSGADWTVVRCSWFMQNFDESFMLDGVLAGEVALPAREVPVPFVDADDIADVAVAALTEDGHEGRVYEMTGSRALTFREAAAEIARATGRDVRYVDVPIDDWVAGAVAAGVPEEEAGLYRYLFTEVLVEANASVGDGVRQALGREPRDFSGYVRGAAAGAWSIQPHA